MYMILEFSTDLHQDLFSGGWYSAFPSFQNRPERYCPTCPPRWLLRALTMSPWENGGDLPARLGSALELWAEDSTLTSPDPVFTSEKGLVLRPSLPCWPLPAVYHPDFCSQRRKKRLTLRKTQDSCWHPHLRLESPPEASASLGE